MWLFLAAALAAPGRGLATPDGQVVLQWQAPPVPQCEMPNIGPPTRSILSPFGGGAAPDPSELQLIELTDALPLPQLATQAEPVWVSGPSETRLDIVFLAEGYLPKQLDDFRDDVRAAKDALLQMEPYASYANLVNFWMVPTPSGEEGMGDAPDLPRDTAFSCTYGCGGLQRLVCCDKRAVIETGAAALPGFDSLIVIGNDERYGGSGGSDYAASFNGRQALDVIAHEMGHSTFCLWDEYNYGTETEQEVPVPVPNCAYPEEVPWEAWRGTEVESGEVGEYGGCSFTNLVRPTRSSCLMHSLREPYCPVCEEAVIAHLHAPLDAAKRLWAQPDPGEIVLRAGESQAFAVEWTGPVAPQFEWRLRGRVISTDRTVHVDACDVRSGQLTVAAWDPTIRVRDPDIPLLDHELSWDLIVQREGQCEPDGCGCQGTPGPLWLGLIALFARRRR